MSELLTLYDARRWHTRLVESHDGLLRAVRGLDDERYTDYVNQLVDLASDLEAESDRIVGRIAEIEFAEEAANNPADLSMAQMGLVTNRRT